MFLLLANSLISVGLVPSYEKVTKLGAVAKYVVEKTLCEARSCD